MNGFHVALIIPTGIGASIGGFGGDAMTLLPLFASVCDRVITHPNVANAACFQSLPSNVLYVEGFGVDQVFRGEWALTPVRQNRIGIIWDSGIEPDMETLHRNTVNAVQTVYGVPVQGWENTETPVGLELVMDPSGRSTGRITNPDVLIQAGARLIAQGAQALAVCCRMPEVADHADETAYRSGQGVDPIGGLEGMISHLLVSQLGIPVAHAPVFAYEDALPVTDTLLDPKAASEFIVSTFLPCVLTGLHKAPQFKPVSQANGSTDLTIADLAALVVPADALGSLPVLEALARRIPVLAVENNTTVMACTADRLGNPEGIVPCASYLEALGHLVALRQGLTPPQHIPALSGTPKIPAAV